MEHAQGAQKRDVQPSKDKADRMDWPVPGSGSAPTPKPVATGFAEPIEEAAEASEGGMRPESPASSETDAGGKARTRQRP
jgi:hypothetical protein